MPRRNPGVFLKASASVEPLIDAAIDETLKKIERGVKGDGPYPAPYRTGALRRSYHWVKTGLMKGRVGNDAGIAPYAPFLELGTSRMPAQPHLLPTAEWQREPFRARVAAAIAEGLRLAGRAKGRQL